MDDKAYRAAAEVAKQAAGQARREARELEEHRAALARHALVWWQGGAAERYQQLVQERVNALTQLSTQLDDLALRADRLAEAFLAEAHLHTTITAVNAAHPVVLR